MLAGLGVVEVETVTCRTYVVSPAGSVPVVTIGGVIGTVGAAGAPETWQPATAIVASTATIDLIAGDTAPILFIAVGLSFA